MRLHNTDEGYRNIRRNESSSRMQDFLGNLKEKAEASIEPWTLVLFHRSLPWKLSPIRRAEHWRLNALRWTYTQRADSNWHTDYCRKIKLRLPLVLMTKPYVVLIFACPCFLHSWWAIKRGNTPRNSSLLHLRHEDTQFVQRHGLNLILPLPSCTCGSQCILWRGKGFGGKDWGRDRSARNMDLIGSSSGVPAIFFGCGHRQEYWQARIGSMGVRSSFLGDLSDLQIPMF